MVRPARSGKDRRRPPEYGSAKHLPPQTERSEPEMPCHGQFRRIQLRRIGIVGISRERMLEFRVFFQVDSDLIAALGNCPVAPATAQLHIELLPGIPGSDSEGGGQQHVADQVIVVLVGLLAHHIADASEQRHGIVPSQKTGNLEFRTSVQTLHPIAVLFSDLAEIVHVHTVLRRRNITFEDIFRSLFILISGLHQKFRSPPTVIPQYAQIGIESIGRSPVEIHLIIVLFRLHRFTAVSQQQIQAQRPRRVGIERQIHAVSVDMLPLFHGIENRAENVVEHTEPVFDEETGELSGPEVFDIRMLAMVHEFRVQGYDMAAECIGGTGLERKPRGDILYTGIVLAECEIARIFPRHAQIEPPEPERVPAHQIVLFITEVAARRIGNNVRPVQSGIAQCAPTDVVVSSCRKSDPGEERRPVALLVSVRPDRKIAELLPLVRQIIPFLSSGSPVRSDEDRTGLLSDEPGIFGRKVAPLADHAVYQGRISQISVPHVRPGPQRTVLELGLQRGIRRRRGQPLLPPDGRNATQAA